MKQTLRQRKGRNGEDRALAFLQTQGLELITRNYSCRLGELDLVMREGAHVVVVEVRMRERRDYGGALASIGPGKQRRIVQATRHLLRFRPCLADHPLRFDVIGLAGDRQPDWIRNAFQAF